MNKVKKLAIPILLAGTAIGGGSQAVADVPITRQSHDFLKIVDNQGVVQPSLSRMTSVNVGVESVAEKSVPPSLYRGGTPVSRPNCGIANQVWENVSIAQNAIEDCFDEATYVEIERDLAHLIEQTSARSGFYSYTEPVSIRTNVPAPNDVEDRYFQIGVFLRANQSAGEAKRIGINITPSNTAKNIYAIYEQPTSLPPIGDDMLMEGAGKLRVYTMDALNPEDGIKPIHTEVTDEFAVNQRSAGDYTSTEQTFYDRGGAVRAIQYLAQYMDEYSSQLAILDYGNPISPLLVPDPNGSGDMVPMIEIETPERWYSRSECTMDNVTYGQRNLTELGTTYKRDRYIINGDAELARNATLGTSVGEFEGETYTKYIVNPESQINVIEDIFNFEAFRGEEPVMLATEHLNAYNYDYNKPISDFQNHITDPYNEYSTPPNNLFRIGERDPFNNIQAEVYKTPVNVVDDSIIKVDYDMRKLVKDGYFTVKKRQAERQVEVCETVQEDVYNDDGEVIDTKPVKECHNETKSYTKKETGEFSGDDSSWNYSNWVKPVYEKVTKHQCIHNTQEENFCETYNCDQTYPEKDDDGYIVDENLPENQNSSFYWDVGDWSGCDGQCGVGTETRSVTCVSTLGGSSSQCTEPKPISERPCQGADANCSFEWKTSDWSNCSEVCDGGFKTRDVYCKAPSGNTVSNKRCDPQNKPNGQTICNTGTCGYSFEKTEWSSCISNARCQPPERTEVCYQIRGKTGAVIGKECYPVVNNPSTARSTGWLNNQTTTLEGYRDTGFNGSHFSCGFSNTSKCWKRHPGKSGERVEGRRTSSVTYGQERRSVKCIRKNDNASVHMGFCGTDQPLTHRKCTIRSINTGCR